MNLANKIVITDIGSTTTKAILLVLEGDKYRLIDYETSGTTVEKPFEDVKIGVFNSLKTLEQKTGRKVLTDQSNQGNFSFSDDVTYLTTSSAGGGLQILVIGLTLADSASSAERAAFGVGGVLLDTIAIDDKRSAIEQMHLLDVLHPDIILFSGGIDGGAVSGVIRLAEILNLSHPKPKFGEKQNIPLVFAGNVEAQNLIHALFKDKYDLHIVPNLRPTIAGENLQPATDKIHELFLNNVMEQAPGYSEIKKIVSDPIIPTPVGVMKTLQLISTKLTENILAFDIGGATTDIFSNILGKYYRTVSANYGMSYSIANVMAEIGFDTIWDSLLDIWQNPNEGQNYIKNYVANKMLYPGYIPQDDYQAAIEHVLAREAIKLSLEQHFKMHFNTRNIGYLEKLKSADYDAFTGIVYYEKTLDKNEFKLKEINVFLGAGGIVSHSSPLQAAMLIIDSCNPEGISEIWRDKLFISPHLGKLSDLNKEISYELLEAVGLEKLVTLIKPVSKKFRKDKKVMTVSLKKGQDLQELEVFGEDLIYIPNTSEIEISIIMEKGNSIEINQKHIELKSVLPIIIDTRSKDTTSLKFVNDKLHLYKFDSAPLPLANSFADFLKQKEIFTGSKSLTAQLPYEGRLFVTTGDHVDPETLLGENGYEPPRIYILIITNVNGTVISPEMLQKGLILNHGDKVDLGQRIFALHPNNLLEGLLGAQISYDSPVRGMVENINFETGTIILREIQDYPEKPVTINIAEKLGIKPKHLKGYLKKRVGDFIYAGECLATNYGKSHPVTYNSHYTGTITNINIQEGSLTIQYLNKPYHLYAWLKGTVKDIVDNRCVEIEYDGTTLNGVIGFGRESGGLAVLYNASLPKAGYQGKVLIYPEKLTYEFLQEMASVNIKGIIAPCIDYDELTRFTKQEIGVALTGKEAIPFGIILTEGFGTFAFDSKIQTILLLAENKYIYLNGRTQIRAGVQRPRIVVLK